MIRCEEAGRRISVWLGLVAVSAAWLAFRLRESALAVVLDLMAIGPAAAGLALLLAAAGLYRLRGTTAVTGRERTPHALGWVVLVAAVVALGAWGWFRSTFAAEEVRFTNGDVELVGTLFLPRGSGPWPAAVLIHGSGGQTRHEGAFLARYLARRGIAGLSYDKRGTGESTGSLYDSDYGDYAADAAAAVELLARRSDVAAGGVGLIGTSEGEWVAPMAAARADTVAFVAVIGASGLSPAEQVTEEMTLRLRAHGYSEEEVERARDLSELVLEYQRSGRGATELAVALDRARSEAWYHDAEDFPDEVYPVEDYAWWRGVMDADPATLWPEVRAPVLLLKGADDSRSRPGPMERRVRHALATGGNTDPAIMVFPGADHLLLRWPLGDRTPPPIFADGYPDVLIEWILRTVGRTAGGFPPADPTLRLSAPSQLPSTSLQIS